MPADIAIKAIKDLTDVLKGQKGKQDDDEFEALIRLERLVINKLTVDPEKKMRTTKHRRSTRINLQG